MRYYQTEKYLIQFNPETNVYKFRNNTKHVDTRISKEVFDTLDAKEIKKDQFSFLMNQYFKSVKHSWEYNGEEYRKLDNFEDSNLEIYHKLPKHQIEGKEYLGNLVLVYHWGRIYYFTWSYNGYPQGQLIDKDSHELVRWARPKHCAPVFNTTTKQYL